MTDTATRSDLADVLRALAISVEDVASCIRQGDDIGHALNALRACGSCLHLAEMTLLHLDQIELRSET